MALRGIRNNNPLNLKYDENAWQGRTGQDADGFAIFALIENGFRAGVKNFVNNQRKLERITIRQYLDRFASDSKEVDKKQYAKFICDRIGVLESTLIVTVDPYKFVAAQALFETPGAVFTEDMQEKVRRTIS